jgi:hypothetical protein
MNMAGISLEYVLIVAYAMCLGLIALLLELVARHAHQRCLRTPTAGFTYHPERDVWRCPRDQHLFPVFSDSARGLTIYRAPAAACNSCSSKPACTDSDRGREVERRTMNDIEPATHRFHRVISLTLLVLACLFLVVECFRSTGFYALMILMSMIMVFSLMIQRMYSRLSPSVSGQQLTRRS